MTMNYDAVMQYGSVPGPKWVNQIWPQVSAFPLLMPVFKCKNFIYPMVLLKQKQKHPRSNEGLPKINGKVPSSYLSFVSNPT